MMPRHLLLAAAAALAAAAPARPEPAAPPNVLVIFIDDLRPELGAYGAPRALTPNIDRLAATAAVFDRAYCQYPVCGPSRASILTGLSPDQLGLYVNEAELRGKRPDLVSLPQLLRGAGYETVSVGKVYDQRVRDDRAWDVEALFGNEHLYAHPENQRRHEENNASRKKDPARPWSAGPVTEIGRAGRGSYPDEEICSRALGELDRLAAGDKPFLLAVGFHRPHLPFAVPEEFWNLYRRDEIPLPRFDQPPEGLPEIAFWQWLELRAYEPIPQKGPLDEATTRELIHGYLASTSFADALAGKMLDRLASLGLSDRTVVLLLGDHGYHLGELAQWAKYVNTELATRAPLMIRAPGMPARRVTEPVEFLDIYPTVAALTGVGTPDGLPGTSLVPALAGNAIPDRPALTQLLRPGRAMGYSLRQGDFRYNLWLHPKTGKQVAEELYDYSRDGIETRNLAGDPEAGETLAKLRKSLETITSRRGREIPADH